MYNEGEFCYYIRELCPASLQKAEGLFLLSW